MKRSPRAIVLRAGFLVLALGACGPQQAPVAAAPPHRTVDSTVPASHSRAGSRNALFSISESDVRNAERGIDAGFAATEDSGVAVSSEAGVDSAEIAWLILHIADEPEHAVPTDTPAVRDLGARGADGVRVVLHLMDGSDPDRAPFARRVVERVIMRSCRLRGMLTSRRLARWLETGAEPADEDLADAGLSFWQEPPDHAFSAAILTRMRRWADDGARCEQTDSPAASDGGTFPDSHE